MGKESIDIKDINPLTNISLRRELEYTDDFDFASEIEKTKIAIYSKAKEMSIAENLLIKGDKLENTMTMKNKKKKKKKKRKRKKACQMQSN